MSPDGSGSPKRTAASNPSVTISPSVSRITSSSESAGCAARNPDKRDASTSRGNHGSTLTLSRTRPWVAAPAASLAASSIPASNGPICAWKRRPSSVSVTAWRPVEQAYAEARFEPSHGAADAGRRHAESLGGSGEVTALHDSSQYPDTCEQSCVNSHDDLCQHHPYKYALRAIFLPA